MQTTASDLKNGFGHYLKEVIEKDEQVIITKNNVPVARLVPYVSSMERYYHIQENALQYDISKPNVSYQEFMEISKNSTARMEFLDGVIYMLSSPNWQHQDALGNLHLLLKRFFEGQKCRPVLAPFDIHCYKKDIEDPDVLQPDLSVLCDWEDKIDEDGRYMGVPTLVIEILSKSTKSRDLSYKLNSYMRSGISEYWIIDVEKRLVLSYHFIDLEIAQNAVHRSGETIVSTVFEGLCVLVKDIFQS